MQAHVYVEAVEVGGYTHGEVAAAGGRELRKHVGRRGSEAEGKACGEAHSGLDADRWAHGNTATEGLGVAGAELQAAAVESVVLGGNGLVAQGWSSAGEVVQAELVRLFGTAPVCGEVDAAKGVEAG